MAIVNIEKQNEEENYVTILLEDSDTVTIRDLDSGVSTVKAAKSYSSGSRIQVSEDFVIIKR